MAVLQTATSSARNMYAGSLTTTSWTVLYTAPNVSSNVTSPSATAYIKEIIMTNQTASVVVLTLALSNSATAGSGIQSYITYQISVGADDSKILSGLNTMLSAGWTIQALAGTASALTLTISGVEVQ